MNNRYYLMRHGQSLANQEGLIVSKPKHAITNFGLTTQGIEQVTEAANKSSLSTQTILVSSDYLRAKQTAEIMHRGIAVETPILIDENLRERDFGNFELGDDKHYPSVWDNDIAKSTMNLNGVEPVNRVLNRALSVINRLEQRFSSSCLLLVGHGDVLQILLSHFHNLDPSLHRTLKPIGNAEIRLLPDVTQHKSQNSTK